MSKKMVAIDCLSTSSKSYGQHDAAVVIDVIRSTTVATTVVETGRRCFFASNVDDALLIANKLDHPLLMGEIGGNMPYGFDLKNSPIDIQMYGEKNRPVVLVSTSGMPLLASLSGRVSLFVACLRNFNATINHLANKYAQIDVLAAPTRGEFREEDKLCCSWIASGLIEMGYEPADKKTKQIIEEMKDQTVKVCTQGNSAKYLRETNQENDLDFIVTHINDFNFPLVVKGNEIVRA